MKKAPMIRSVIRLAIGLLIVGVIAAEFSVVVMLRWVFWVVVW